MNEFTWTQVDDQVTVTSEGEDTVFTSTADGLTISYDEYTMVFTTEPPVAVDLGNVVDAADAAAFNGTWNCAYVGMGGQTMSMSMMVSYWEMIFGTSDTTIVMTDGTAVICGGDPIAFTFADGKLSYAVEGNDVSSQTIQLTDAGYLVYTMDDLELAMYCEPVAE